MNTIQGLWVGDRLSTMEQLCIRSYLANGHEFHLYTYGYCKGVPEGTINEDASTIVPREDIKRFRNLPNFSDWWRWNLLYKKGGWWVDLDTVCIRPLDFADEYVFTDGECAKGKNRVGAGNIKLPPQSELAAWAIEQIDAMDIAAVGSRDFSGFGPTLLCAGINKFKLHRYTHPVYQFLPPIFPTALTKDKVTLHPDTYVIHLWDNIWKHTGMNKDGTYAAHSLYEQLKHKYLSKSPTALHFKPLKWKNVLIAIVSCDKKREMAAAQAATWTQQAEDAGYDVVFFDGENLGVPDAPYPVAIIEKASAIYRWAYEHGYDGVLKCDDDCYINVKQFTTPTADYAGIPCGPNDGGLPLYGVPNYPKGTFPHQYASGGAAWFSRRSLEVLLAALPIEGDWADDRWAGQRLAEAGIPFTPLKEFYWYPLFLPSGREFSVLTQLPTANSILRIHQGIDIRKACAEPKAVGSKPVLARHPITIPNWQFSLLETKVKAIFDRIRVAKLTRKDGELEELRRKYPDHTEEQVDGNKILFMALE